MKPADKHPNAQRMMFAGMHTVAPPDAMPPNKFPYALNVRAYQAQAIGPRKPQGASLYTPDSGAVHSLKRLNDNNVSPGYGVWVHGEGISVHVGNQLAATGFSGNRLGMASYRPASSPRPWMYIADSVKAVKTNAANPGSQTFSTGITEPQQAVVVFDAGVSATGPTMPVFYQFKWRSSITGAVSNPSPPMRVGFNVTGHAPQFFGLIASVDPQVDLVDVYRQDPGLLSMTYVTTIANGGNFLDNVSDTTLLGNPLMQFDDYEPFPSIDLPRNFFATVSSAHIITWFSGDQFNVRWLPGTQVLRVASATGGYSALTLYRRPPSTTSIEVLEDLTAFIGSTLQFTIPEPILAAQRLPTLWGPTDNAGYFFAVGDPLRLGTLYFTKGNNPDSAPQTNQIEITSPSEPLVNGAIVNGLGIVMSTERGWLIYPNFSNAVATVLGVQGSAFQPIETIEGYGLYAKEGICTDGGANLFFWSKEGIRKSPGGFGSKSLTDDDLYNLFPHEGQPQQTYTLGSYTVKPPDYNNPNSFALRFAEGYLYADYKDAQGGYWTLVLDTVTGGWCVDQYSAAAAIHADTEGVGVGTATGCLDGTVRLLTPTGNEVQNMVLATRSFDAGDIRNPKRFIDAYVEAAVQAGDVPSLDLWLSRYTDKETPQLSQLTLPGTAGVRTGTILYLASGTGVYATDMALVFTVPLVADPPTLIYAWEPTFADWAELITLWQTELFSYDIAGWQHIPALNLVYAATAPLILSLTFDGQSVAIPSVTIPASGGNKTKVLVLIPANKFKLNAWRITSTAPFRLWKNDIEVKVGQWGRSGAYQVLHPFHRSVLEGSLV